jgi:hypothetical protein
MTEKINYMQVIDPQQDNNIQITATATTGTGWPPTPKAYQLHGSCPKCGAPLYLDAHLPKKKNGNPTQLPFVYYTCSCRLIAAPIPQVYTYPIMPAPMPQGPTWKWTPPTTGDPMPFPGSTTICKGEPLPAIKPLNDGIDWHQFTGSGHAETPPHLRNLVCINAAASNGAG